MKDYKHFYDRSINSPQAFWKEQAEKIDWFTFPKKILSKDKEGFDRWYEGGKLNTCYLALDKHVNEGRGDQTALIYDSPVTGKKAQYTFKQLLHEVEMVAGMLVELGVTKGDRVIIYMPMIPQTAFAMLACARIGAIHSVVFGGFAPRELAIRIDDAQPKVLLTASGGLEIKKVIPYKDLVDEALAEASHKVEKVVIYQRPFVQGKINIIRDIDWEKLRSRSKPAPYVKLDAWDPLYIIYTSGTTGTPKGVVRDNGGHAVALKFSMQHVYGAQPGEVFWAASDVGWVVGHSYILYGPLIHGCTTILFEGKPIKTPNAGTFWRIISEYGVNVFFTAPTAFRAIVKQDSQGLFAQQFDLSKLKYLFLAGERCDSGTLEWLQHLLGIPVIDHWWQTESGWPMIANMPGIELLSVKAGSAGVPVPGYDIRILDGQGRELPANEEGEVAIRQPLPPGTLPNLWNNSENFSASYFERYPGFYNADDSGYIDDDGYIFITGRIDDIINVAGHRLSTATIEEIIAVHDAVAECAVIGVHDPMKGQVPVGFVVLKDGVDTSFEVLTKELVQTVRQKLGAVAAFKTVFNVKRLPKTRSGKILRKTMRTIADKKTYTVPSTIENPVVLEEICSILSQKKKVST